MRERESCELITLQKKKKIGINELYFTRRDPFKCF